MSESGSNWVPRSLSIVIPISNEAENAKNLVEATTLAARDLEIPFELILVDDGSSDSTASVLRGLRNHFPELVVVRLRRNFGQTLALLAGFDRSRGDAVVTMDGDLQNDPADIPTLLDELCRGADAVSGWRRNRKDGIMRLLPSQVANWLIRRLIGIDIHDQGCALKAYRGELVRSLGLYADMHRFIATLMLPLGARIVEVEVQHHPRVAGTSHYGVSRLFRVLADLFTLQMLTRFWERPLRWFTTLGLPFLVASTLAGAMAFLGDPHTMVVWTSVFFLSISTLGTCLLLGLLGEVALESAGPARSRPIIRRQWGAE
jgi:glycosyltransferase involved in cell wall biosynthesis